jgi:hypothetical protein
MAAINPTPTVTDVEATTATAVPNFTLNAVETQIVDQDGNGFRTWLEQVQALDLVRDVLAAVARLRGATP